MQLLDTAVKKNKISNLKIPRLYFWIFHHGKSADHQFLKNNTLFREINTRKSVITFIKYEIIYFKLHFLNY